MKRILGTTFEISLRILILLNEARKLTLTVGKIAALDFIAIYARDFDLSDKNLHGDSIYRFGEFVTRRELVHEGIKRLVLEGLVFVKTNTNAQMTLNTDGLLVSDTMDKTMSKLETQNGFEYYLSDVGKNFVASFESGYAIAYRKVVAHTINVMASKSEFDLYGIISRRTIVSLQEERVNG